MTDDDIINDWECDVEPADLIRSRRELAIEVKRLRTDLTLEQLASSDASIDLADLVAAARQLLAVTECANTDSWVLRNPPGHCGHCRWCTVYAMTREDAT